MLFYFVFVISLVDFKSCTGNGHMCTTQYPYNSSVDVTEKRNIFKKLIYVGKPFRITEAPYIAIYSEPRGSVCGASIVHRRFLILAAHCLQHNTFVKVGTDTLKGGRRYSIQRQIAHPKYNSKTVDYDLAIIHLCRDLVFSCKVRPIRMAEKNMKFMDGDMMMTLGFGKTETSRQSHRLLKIDIPYVPRKACSQIYKTFTRITKNMICAGGVDGKDVCDGDSGGPLVYIDFLVGVVSFGVGCGCHPSVFTSIPALRTFIDKTIKSFSCGCNCKEKYLGNC